MAAVTGPPAELAAAREDLTPMLEQYVALCEEYDDALVLFRVGDFYKSFGEVAEWVARTCELTLVEREDSTGTYSMAGIPVDSATKYLERLLDAGYRLAIADQVEDPDETSGLVDRAVTRIVTPGTVVEDDLLDPGTATYVAAVARGEGCHAVAAVDVSTGECRVTSADDADRLRAELDRLAPAELLVGPDTTVDAGTLAADPVVTDHDPTVFESEAATRCLGGYLSQPERVLGCEAERRACGAVLAYAEYTQGDDGPLDYVSRVLQYDPREFLRLDATAIRALELFESRSRGGTTVLSVVDETVCAPGRRLLAAWLRRPLADPDDVATRQDAVGDLASRSLTREALRDHLADVYDLERLAGRIGRGRADARDLRSLHATLSVVPAIRESLADVEAARLRDRRDALDDLADVRDLIDRAIAPDPPAEVTEGGVVREGFDADLDDLRATEREGREWIADLEERERERTGIDSLSVGHNQVHGYYIEVTNANLDRVPDDYTRRQTLKNAERFYTPELKRREDEIFGATERAEALEYRLFREIRETVAEETDRIQALADALAELDALASLATVSVANDYVRPTLGSDRIHVEGGRHPVVERTQPSFVPNDADVPRGEVAIITGPNMSGKSTYMRQVALICVLAQVGGFVPADDAHLPILDRVFTRVGASDDIAGGQSTFMREMAELTDILHGATEDSLVLLDEVGRGTSTADGLAIARATTEFLHDEVGATTLFATHYHDLAALADEREGVFALHFTADRDGDRVTFLHRVAEGASSSSYGVEVARLAGVPEAVVERAADLVSTETADGPVASDASADADGKSAVASERDHPTDGTARLGDDTDRLAEETDRRSAERAPTEGRTAARPDGASPPDDAPVDVLATLRAVEVAETTPLEALQTLHDLQRRLDDA